MTVKQDQITECDGGLTHEPGDTKESRRERRAGGSLAAPSIHAGHRARMRALFLGREMVDPQPLEALELLLFYALPRGDVNPLAHRLLDRFGSLTGVMEASPEALMSVEGVGESTAVLIHLLPAILRVCEGEQAADITVYDSLSKMEKLLRPKFRGLWNERLYLVMLDNGLHLIDCVPIAEGAVNNTAANIRFISEHCLNRHAACAVLAHNHPHGMAIPSSMDIELTGQADAALDLFGIPLLEHLIITEHSCAPIMRSRKGMLRSSPVPGDAKESFFRSFYGEDS